jgi:hypothetical protein
LPQGYRPTVTPVMPFNSAAVAAPPSPLIACRPVL